MSEVISMKKKQHSLFLIRYSRQVLTLLIYVFVTSAYFPVFVLFFLTKICHHYVEKEKHWKRILNSLVINLNSKILLNQKAFVYMQLSHGF